MNIGGYETHAVADIYPLMDGDEFADLVADVRAHGLRAPIWRVLVDGETFILDGRNRLRACLDAGVEPRFQDYDGPTDLAALVSFSRSQNLARRHLTPSQAALIAAKCKELYEEAARLRQISAQNNTRAKAVQARMPELPPGQARDHAARDHGVSPRMVEYGSTVLKRGTDEVIEAVERGELALTAAAELVELEPSAQREVLDAVRDSPRKLRSILRQRETARVNQEEVAKRVENAPAGVRDARGRDVPDHLAAAYADLERAYSEAAEQLDAGRKRILEAHKRWTRDSPPALRKKMQRHFEGQEVLLRLLANTTRRIADHYQPHVLCPSCDGDGCEDCREVGWISRTVAGEARKAAQAD